MKSTVINVACRSFETYGPYTSGLRSTAWRRADSCSALAGSSGHISGRVSMPSVEARTSLSFLEAREVIWNGLTADTSRRPRVRVRTFSSTSMSKISPLSTSSMIVTMFEPPKVSLNFWWVCTYSWRDGSMSSNTVRTSMRRANQLNTMVRKAITPATRARRRMQNAAIFSIMM